jgi:hypothetical protein
MNNRAEAQRRWTEAVSLRMTLILKLSAAWRKTVPPLVAAS